ncbi:MAG TPA: aminotransferase class IV [Chitinophagaceae bacterium]|nr:aminotransferase class IV [Chitinophagaceae bacterium]
MSDFVMYNGRFFKSDTPLVGAANRGLRYGDGLFETIRYSNGQLQLAEAHFNRLFKGLSLLGFELPRLFTPQALADQAVALCKKNQQATARVRINLFRGNGGVYDPENHAPHCIIESWALPSPDFALNENGLVTGIYADARKPMDAFANLKTNQYLPYLMAAIHAKKERWNEVFVLNTSGRICDASIANVFIVKNNTICTPPLSEGGIAGVMRGFLLDQLPQQQLTVVEQPITIDDLLNADEVFLTNAVRGIRWVAHCDASTYGNQCSSFIFQKLLKS